MKGSFKVKNTAGMFDLIKGITMLMVIFVHTYGLFPFSFIYQNTYEANIQSMMGLMLVPHLFVTIYSLFAHALMPAFFVVAGYGIRKMTIEKSIKKQSTTLLIPYAITAVLTSILHLITHYTLYRYFPGSFKETLRIAGGFLLGLSKTSTYFGVKIFSCGPIWFGLALFWGLIVFNILLKYVQERFFLLASIGVAFVGWLLSLGNTVPWCISQGLVATFYICLGYLAKKKKWFTNDISTKSKLLILFLVILPNFVIRFIGTKDGMADNVYPLGMATILFNGIMGLVCIYFFLRLNKYNGKITGFIRKIGRFSIYVMCVHTIEMMGFPYYYFANNWTGNVSLGCALLFIIRASIDIIICFAFVALKERAIERNNR